MNILNKILVKARELIFSLTTGIVNVSKRIKKQNNFFAVILSQIYLMFLTCCIVYIAFRIQIKDTGMSTIQWLFENIEVTLLSCLLVFIICEVFYLLSFILYFPLVLVYPITIVAAVANIFKMQFREEPVIFADIFLVREVIDIAESYPIDFEMFKGLPAVIFAVLLVLPLFIKRIKLNLIKRVIFIILAAAITMASFYTLVVPDETFIENNIHRSLWNLSTEYERNGFVLGFFTSFKRSLIFAPKNYNENTVKQYAGELGYRQDNQPTISMNDDELPNIIVIMNESYWDCNNLTGISLNKDPMESVREMWDASGNSSILSSQVGGGTANTEYEFLTGKSVFYYPEGSVVYQQYITKKQWSLAWYFRDFGYVTTAIHPYYDWFWKRNTIYPMLGFENVYFAKDMAYIDRRGQFISDRALTKEIIHKYERLSDNGGKPIFTFAVSMQNHGAYYDSRYPNREIRLASPRDPETDAIVEVFSEGMRYASEAFVTLTEYFENIERPTYIVIFGDHAPTLAFNKNLYALNENFEMYSRDTFNGYRTPLIIWTNNKGGRGKNMEEIARNIPENITPYMFTDELLNITGIPKPKYIEMLSNIRNYTEGFTNKFILDKNGALTTFEKSPEIKAIIDKLEICQYDSILGKNYVINEFVFKNSE